MCMSTCSYINANQWVKSGERASFSWRDLATVITESCDKSRLAGAHEHAAFQLTLDQLASVAATVWHGAGLIPHDCPAWTDTTTVKWSYFLIICRQQLCESKCGRGWSTSLLPPSFFIPSISSLLQSKQQVDPYQPSVTAAAPHTFLIGPWGIGVICGWSCGQRIDESDDLG